MNDIIITRATIKEIASRIYDDVDSNDYQDAGYMLKDIELAVRKTLCAVAQRATDHFEVYAFGPDREWEFFPIRYCDADGCEVPVRADGDIWCYYHGALEDKRSVEASALVQFDDDDIPF